MLFATISLLVSILSKDNGHRGRCRKMSFSGSTNCTRKILCKKGGNLLTEIHYFLVPRLAMQRSNMPILMLIYLFYPLARHLHNSANQNKPIAKIRARATNGTM
jgi:hypothetical protein